VYDYLSIRHLTGKVVYLNVSGGKVEFKERVPAHEPGDQNIFQVVCVGAEGMTVSPVYKPREAGYDHDRFILFRNIW
jgi:hypothetical protein